MNEVVFKTLKQKDFIVKNFVLKVATELDLSLNDAILLIYLSNQEVPTLDIDNIKDSTYLSEESILESFGKLIALNLIETKTQKLKSGKIEEIISLDGLIKSVTKDITTEMKRKEEVDLYTLFEGEFGRPLSSMEFQIINKWTKMYNSKLIEEALREAVYNNAKSFRYIESILNTWSAKGYKNPEDVHNAYIEKSKKAEIVDLPEASWLDE